MQWCLWRGAQTGDDRREHLEAIRIRLDDDQHQRAGLGQRIHVRAVRSKQVCEPRQRRFAVREGRNEMGDIAVEWRQLALINEHEREIRRRLCKKQLPQHRVHGSQCIGAVEAKMPAGGQRQEAGEPAAAPVVQDWQQQRPANGS